MKSPGPLATVIVVAVLLQSERLLADGCPVPSFAAARVVAAGTNSVFVAVRDLNGDGTPDLVVANDTYPGTVSVLLGNGDGSFQEASRYRVGSALAHSARSVTVDDFNGDAKPDLAVATRGAVSVLLGKGDGTFQTAVNYGMQWELLSIAAGDFNGDGKPDLAVASEDCGDIGCGGNVSVMSGMGEGIFQTAVIYVTSSHIARPQSVTVGDFNRDGKSDLAVTTVTALGGVLVFLGKGDGTFQTPASYSGTGASLAVGDFNDDGTPDFAVANYSSGVSVSLGQGDGTFQPMVNYGTAPYPRSVAVGDFNGDGRSDLAVANAGSDNVSVLLGNGDGTFQTAVNFSTAGSPRSVAVGDFNGDGQPDLAVVNDGSGNVAVLLNTCVSAAVRLAIARQNTNLTLSWSLAYSNFVLESTANLGSTNWQGVSEAVKTNHGRCEVGVPLGQGQRYFRLQKP